MNAYAVQEEDLEVSELATDAFNKLPQCLLDEVSETLQKEIWKSLYGVTTEIRNHYAAIYQQHL
jgi:hypothetical protein